MKCLKMVVQKLNFSLIFADELFFILKFDIFWSEHYLCERPQNARLALSQILGSIDAEQSIRRCYCRIPELASSFLPSCTLVCL